MTEAEWLTSDDVIKMYAVPTPMHSVPQSKARLSRRVASLFAIACVRATPQAEDQTFLKNAESVVEVAIESGQWGEVDALYEIAGERCNEVALRSTEHQWALAALRLTDDTIDCYAFHVPLFILKALAGTGSLADLRHNYADSLRDVVGNPFRGGRAKRMKQPQIVHPSPVIRNLWRTSTVLSLAQHIYDSRDFSTMPILADALQDEGCDSDDIPNHCRNANGVHVRGCWVVDHILGKT